MTFVPYETPDCDECTVCHRVFHSYYSDELYKDQSGEICCDTCKTYIEDGDEGFVFLFTHHGEEGDWNIEKVFTKLEYASSSIGEHLASLTPFEREYGFYGSLHIERYKIEK